MTDKCWDVASGKHGDRAVREFEMKIRTKDIEGAYGARSRAEASLAEPAPYPSQKWAPPYPSCLAYPHPSDGGALLVTPCQHLHTQH